MRGHQAGEYAEVSAPFIAGLANVPFSNQIGLVFDMWDKTLEATGRVLDIQRGFAKTLHELLNAANDKVGSPPANSR